MQPGLAGAWQASAPGTLRPAARQHPRRSAVIGAAVHQQDAVVPGDGRYRDGPSPTRRSPSPPTRHDRRRRARLVNGRGDRRDLGWPRSALGAWLQDQRRPTGPGEGNLHASRGGRTPASPSRCHRTSLFAKPCRPSGRTGTRSRPTPPHLSGPGQRRRGTGTRPRSRPRLTHNERSFRRFDTTRP